MARIQLFFVCISTFVFRNTYVGLVKASNKGGKKWIGVCGLIFTALSILSIIVPAFIATVPKAQTVEVLLPENRETDLRQEKGVLLSVEGYQLKCFDNREPSRENVERRL